MVCYALSLRMPTVRTKAHRRRRFTGQPSILGVLDPIHDPQNHNWQKVSCIRLLLTSLHIESKSLDLVETK